MNGPLRPGTPVIVPALFWQGTGSTVRLAVARSATTGKAPPNGFSALRRTSRLPASVAPQRFRPSLPATSVSRGRHHQRDLLGEAAVVWHRTGASRLCAFRHVDTLRDRRSRLWRNQDDREFSVTTNVPGPGLVTNAAGASANNTRAGWTVGAGSEWMIGNQWSAKLEYLYIDFGTFTDTFVGAGFCRRSRSALMSPITSCTSA